MTDDSEGAWQFRKTVAANTNCTACALLCRYTIMHMNTHTHSPYKVFFCPPFPVIVPSSQAFLTEKSWAPHRSSSIHWKCHQTVCICASSLAVWHFAQSFHALRPLLSYMDIMCSLCVSEDILYDSHHLHSQLSLQIPLARTQYCTVKNYCAWELGNFNKK